MQYLTDTMDEIIQWRCIYSTVPMHVKITALHVHVFIAEKFTMRTKKV